MGESIENYFRYEDDPDLPGWKRWELTRPCLFNQFIGPIHVRPEEGMVRVRMMQRSEHGNLRGDIHGGALMGFLDLALFAAARGFGIITAGPAATIEMSTQFIGGAALDRPVEAHIELLRETGRFLFLRGLVDQDGETVASFSALIRKPSQPR